MFIEHIGIQTKDAEKSAEFYCKNLGFEICGDHLNERVKIIFLKAENGVIELVQNLKQPQERVDGVVDHIAFRVHDIEREVEKLKAAGVELISEKPMDFKQDKVFFFRGPNGERLEFVGKGN